MPKIKRELRTKEVRVHLRPDEHEALLECAREMGYVRLGRWIRETAMRAARGMGTAPGGIAGTVVRETHRERVGAGVCEKCGRDLKNPRKLSRGHSPMCMRFMPTMEDK